MKMGKALLLTTFAFGVLSTPLYAAKLALPQPTTCVTPAFSRTGNFTISIKLTNNCGAAVDFQNSTITFVNATQLTQPSFWGNFSPLAYPDNNLAIAQQPATGGFLESMPLHFPEQPWANTILKAGQSFTLIYWNGKADYNASSALVYLNSVQPPVQTGKIDLSSNTAQPAGVSQAYSLIDIVTGGKVISTVQLPWKGTQAIAGVHVGTYTIQPESLTDTQGNTYQGTANPSSVAVIANQKVASAISYSQIVKYGSVKVQVPVLPSALTGYTGKPSVTLTNASTGSTVIQSMPWNTTTTVTPLENGTTYSFFTPLINYQNSNCVGSFSPSSLVSSPTPLTTQLTYQCTTVAQDKVNLSVNGAPANTPSLTVTLTPANGAAAVVQSIALTNGTGSTTVSLTDGMIYNVTSSAVTGYTATFNPQPLTAVNGGSETITLKQQVVGGGRIISYMPGWKTPPAAADLAKAGYTNMLVAFGVFSTTNPGQIVSAFDTITPAYITSLHNAGIKVSLSLGGASTSIANTSVNFNQVRTAAGNDTTFEQAFVKSLEVMLAQYGFDGVDFDIEQGFNGTGTFTQPTGDIAALSVIINKLRADNPTLLISLVPQAPNISATAGFDNVWGNYSSLIMQTHSALSWVGVQVYNTGCVFGLDQVCYGQDVPSNPDMSVALAADLLESWPAKTADGRATGFQPYISYLTPNQVVLGYPAPNKAGTSDGSPVTPVSTIKRAIQCLATNVKGASSCNTYVPPKAYAGFGGVFNWEITYDQNNNYSFATSLATCVMTGVCS
jgi:chitinase